MTLFTLLLVLMIERLFKLGEHWQLDHRLNVVFRCVSRFSLVATLTMAVTFMLIVWLLLQAVHGIFFNVLLLIVWILLGLLCIGAGEVSLHYHTYLSAASREEEYARDAMAAELTLIHGVPPTVTNWGIYANCKMRCCGLTIVFILCH